MLNLKRLKKDGDLIPNRRIAVREGIHLGGYHTGDKKRLVKYLNDVAIYTNTLNIPHPYEAKDAEWWIDHIAQEKRRLGLQPNWTIRNSDNELIGGIGMVINGDTIAPHQEIGYWLAEPYRRQGIMTDVIKVFSRHCFQKYKDIEAITAHIFHHNEASMSTVKKAGFTMVRLIDDYYKKGDQVISAYEFINERKVKRKGKK